MRKDCGDAAETVRKDYGVVTMRKYRGNNAERLRRCCGNGAERLRVSADKMRNNCVSATDATSECITGPPYKTDCKRSKTGGGNGLGTRLPAGSTHGRHDLSMAFQSGQNCQQFSSSKSVPISWSNTHFYGQN